MSNGELLLQKMQYGRTDVVTTAGGSICGCLSDFSTCLLGWVCPCYLFGRNLRQAGIFRTVLGGILIYGAICMAVGLMSVATLVHIFPEYIDRLNHVTEVYCNASITDGSAAGHGDYIEMPAESSSRLHTHSDQPSGPAPDDGAHCISKIMDTILWFEAHLLVVYLFSMVLMGGVLGYYRGKIRQSLAIRQSLVSSDDSKLCSRAQIHDCALHCMPCTNACALCQEARALEHTMATAAYAGL